MPLSETLTDRQAAAAVRGRMERRRPPDAVRRLGPTANALWDESAALLLPCYTSYRSLSDRIIAEWGCRLRDHDRLIDFLWTIGTGPEHLAAPHRYTTVHKTLRGCGSHHNPLMFRAGPTRLELATSGVTGQSSNQLNYDPRTT